MHWNAPWGIAGRVGPRPSQRIEFGTDGSARPYGLSLRGIRGEALLTCAKTNAASIRTIRGSGGVFLSEEYLEHRGEVVQRYRIALSNPGT